MAVEPIFLTYQDPFERFRIGDGEGSWNADPAKQKVLAGSQFPVEAYANYMKQSVPRWLSTDNAIIAAYLEYVDKVCPCVLLLHSQGGTFGFKVAEQRPDKIKAIVAVESATAGIVANAPKLKDIPVLMLFGDYVDQHPRWATFKKIDTEYGNAIKAAGGTVDWINLPGHRHQGQWPHDDAGQEQYAGRRGHPEMAGRQRTGGLTARVPACCSAARAFLAAGMVTGRKSVDPHGSRSDETGTSPCVVWSWQAVRSRLKVAPYRVQGYNHPKAAENGRSREIRPVNRPGA